MTDEKKPKYNRRTRMEMIEAVREADRLMAGGIPCSVALRECNLSQSNYHFNKQLLLGEEAMEKSKEQNPNRESQQEWLEGGKKPNNSSPQAWECPRCGQINAMWKGSCDCRRR